MFGCRREGFTRIGGLGCGKADKFGAAEGEGGGDEDGAETFKTVAKGTRVVPVVGADVASVVCGHTAAVDDNTEDDEAADCDNLDQREGEFNWWKMLNNAQEYFWTPANSPSP